MNRIPLTKDGEILIKEKLSNLKFIEGPKISEASPRLELMVT